MAAFLAIFGRPPAKNLAMRHRCGSPWRATMTAASSLAIGHRGRIARRDKRFKTVRGCCRSRASTDRSARRAAGLAHDGRGCDGTGGTADDRTDRPGDHGTRAGADGSAAYTLFDGVAASGEGKRDAGDGEQSGGAHERFLPVEPRAATPDPRFGSIA
jgi:hypothetical protein